MLTDGAFGYLAARIDASVQPWSPQEKKPTDGTEDKYRFLRYVEKLEGTPIHGPLARR